ncbi:MAG: hypothetical protein FWE95_06160 [Planctomycetaceae bacterium]|nr:hypothetical protein [Planctomycetaceae bacterium]
METVPIITESVQYGVIGICIMLIIADAVKVRSFIAAQMKLHEKIDQLNVTINELTTEVKMLTIRTKMSKRGMTTSSCLLPNSPDNNG